MERLTKKDYKTGWPVVRPDCTVYSMTNRLAAIEDILGDDYELDHLRELVQAERDGRCIYAPAQIGDIVYHITTCKDFAKVLDGTMYGPNGGVWNSDRLLLSL